MNHTRLTYLCLLRLMMAYSENLLCSGLIASVQMGIMASHISVLYSKYYLTAIFYKSQHPCMQLTSACQTKSTSQLEHLTKIIRIICPLKIFGLSPVLIGWFHFMHVVHCVKVYSTNEYCYSNAAKIHVSLYLSCILGIVTKLNLV